MKKTILASIFSCLLILSSCKDDDSEELIDFAVTFNSSTVGLGEDDATTDITLDYSRAATEAGTINVTYTGSNATYGTDFTTSPDGSSGTLSIPVAVGDVNATFTFTKLQDAIEGTTKSVSFSIDGFDNMDWVEGATTSSEVSFTPVASPNGVVDAENGGSTMPNQVYFDFSTGTQTTAKRDSWEIAFYNGTENRVFLNPSMLVSAAELPGVTDLLSVTSTSDLPEQLDLFALNFQTFQLDPVTVTTVGELIAGLPVGYTQYGNLDEGIAFTDDAEGTLDGTAFAEVSTTADENNVYIVSLGNEVPTEDAEPGSINTTGDHRGYMKVRVLTDGNSYTVQFADLDETTSFSEVTVSKDSAYSLSAFSLTTGATTSVEPAAASWDINLSGVFSFYGFSQGVTAGLTYSDYVVHNTLGGVGLYQVTTYTTDSEGVVTELDVPSYTEFNMGDVDEASLEYTNRGVIGSGWRNSFAGVLKDDRYFVLKDTDGNYYKMMFTAYLSATGERGNPQFTYERL